MNYVIIWTYEVDAPNELAFCAAYGPNGDWAALFARAPGFIDIELLYDGGRYATIDRWESPEAFDSFKTAHGAAYDALDAKCGHLTRAEHRIGAFTVQP